MAWGGEVSYQYSVSLHGANYLTSESPFLNPTFRISLSAFIIKSLSLSNPGLFALLLGLGSCSRFMVRFHQPLLTFLLDTIFVKLIVRNIEEWEGGLLLYILL